MSGLASPPKSPTLLPPGKSVELEDPGAHELSASDTEEDVFSDAQEGDALHSRPSSPIPTTRVEKVDDRESHGEVPGTPAYKLREQDAVPDEVEVVPDGKSRSRTISRAERPASSEGSPIPKTIVEKVDPLSPSHGDVPGTAAFSKRMADAVPDEIRGTPNDSGEPSSNEDLPGAKTAEVSVPRTVITRVDSKPSHGEVPGTEAYDIRKGDAKPDIVEKSQDVKSESQLSSPGMKKNFTDKSSPIAADGGFGPMSSGESDPESTDTETSSKTEDKEHNEENHDNSNEGEDDDGFGDDFDDFEAGAEDEDFGEFDEAKQQALNPSLIAAKPMPKAPPIQLLPAQDIAFPLLDLSELDTLDEIMDATAPFLDEIFPTTRMPHPEPPPPPPGSKSIFLTDRSQSLWSQLVAPPPLQPPNWVRSRIRRLFLVSLGVPVDLDEILPASKQKKLILPSTNLRSGSPSPSNGQRTGSRVRLKQDNASSTSIDKQGTLSKSKRRRGPAAAPELDLQATKMLCTTTEAALSNMTDEELHAHMRRIDELTAKASEVLEYWLKRRDSALGDKEAFEGVIENLVKHARRVRK